MVFSEGERATLRDASDFGAYLAGHPGAALAVARTPEGPLPVEVAEGYCRWAHPERVAAHLTPERLPVPLTWSVIDLAPYLAAVCRSHGHDARTLYDDDAFPTELLADIDDVADLRMCAVLLRLADILDFDRSRTPETLYRYLGLAESAAARDQVSDREWRKHYSCAGFRFPKDRTAGYTLAFVAGPDDPAVERDIREFLDVIEEEFRVCAKVVRTCADHWRDLPLPGPIRRDQIRSQGYTYGPYRFTASRTEVLELFTGDNLYDTPYAFLRELLQNALDTSRDRAFAEEARTGRPHTPGPVRVRDWRDREGCLWIEVSDDGRGMDEHILRDYFLQVGRSYYTSEEFQAELLTYEHGRGREFTPISRFGIGILSCFSVADRVELSTLRASPDAHPIRLSMWGRDGFFALQTPPAQYSAKPMPGPHDDLPGYRTTPGTTITLRIDPRRERGDLDVRAELDSWIAFPETPVEYAGDRVGLPATLLSGPPGPLKVPVPDLAEQLNTFGKELGIPQAVDPALALVFTPLPLPELAPEARCGGLLFAVHLTGVRTTPLGLGPNRHRTWDVRLRGLSDILGPDGTEGIFLVVEFQKHDMSRTNQVIEPQTDTYRVDLSALLYSHPEWRDVLSAIADLPVLSHNGMFVPFSLPFDEQVFPSRALLTATAEERAVAHVFGHFALGDRLRPDVDVARGRVRDLGWPVLSAIELATRRALSVAGLTTNEGPIRTDTNELRRSADPALTELMADPLLVGEHGWAAEQIVRTSSGTARVDDLTVGDRVEFNVEPVSDFTARRCAWTLLATRTRLVVTDVNSALVHARVDAVGPQEPSAAELLFPPLFFLTVEGSDGLVVPGVCLNREHPYTRWLLRESPALAADHSAFFATLRRETLNLVAMLPRRTDPEVVTRINDLLDRLEVARPQADKAPRLRIEGLLIRKATR
ncbi:hypothetical protein [Actinocorallia sp. A-T 12471]|uniref:HD domain-containing protein n=1 Tax=Actinocorallia sp. A-T 12471 TaxID=3089813 RepID=UPI0029D38D25|nr:hypothetical protein [Actinocorallia sp. A-T 12471]MDX6743676.1 hypothetical protein [Actinocorallia sp. A-T 12471]